MRRGIILAGGSGTRLHPLTKGVSRQHLPVLDKPMIYHPLSVLMLLGIREALVITTPHEEAMFQLLVGNGSQWAISIEWAIQPSPGGELEIPVVNEAYLNQGQLSVERLGRGSAWLDTGTFESLIQAGQFIQTIEERQGLRIACPEEITWVNGWIDDEALSVLAANLSKNPYGKCLQALLHEGKPNLAVES